MAVERISAVQEDILNRLIDGYERRSDYGGTEKSPRRTMLKINKKSFPDYYHVSDSSYRHMLNAEMVSLAKEKLVELKWQRFNEGEILEKIILSEPAIQEIYKLLNRATREEIYNETIANIRALRAEAPASALFFYDLLIENLAAYKALPPPLRVDKRADLLHTLRGLNALLTPREEEVAKRVLSVKLYKDSKRWQQLEKNILQIYRKFFITGSISGPAEGIAGPLTGVPEGSLARPQPDSQTVSQTVSFSVSKSAIRNGKSTDSKAAEPTGRETPAESATTSDDILWTESENEAILSEAGIADNPTHIRLSGPLIIEAERKETDLSVFAPDIGFPSKMAQTLKIVRFETKKVMVIENLTTYYQYLAENPKEELVIYSGGFTGRGLRVLLQKIHHFTETKNCDTSYRFWGDIDMGGFRIWHHIREKTGIHFKPFMMDGETYLKHLQLGHPMTEKYTENLEQLLQKPELAPFHAVIALMLKHKIRIEQEAISLQSKGK